MAIVLAQPKIDELREIADVLRDWQRHQAAWQLHPGDLGWYWRFGAQATAAAVRTWRRDGRVLAVGLQDGPNLVRITTAPHARRDEDLARQLCADLTEPDRGVAPNRPVALEAPMDALVRDLLAEDGWSVGEPWTPLRRDLTHPVPDPGVRVEVVGPQQAHVRTAVHRASFDGSTFSDQRWHAMADGFLYSDARCLVAYDAHGDPAAATTVWSAGPGRPGLLEPMGVHRDCRRRGLGAAVTLAAAATLRELGSSSATVCTPSDNVGAVASYKSAGFAQLPEVWDVCQDA